MGLVGGAVAQGQGIADADVPDGLDAGDDVADRPGGQPVGLLAPEPAVPDLVHRVFVPGVHEPHPIAGGEGTVADPAREHDSAIDVVLRIEHQGLQRRLRLSGRGRQALHDPFEHPVDSDPVLRRDGRGGKGIEPEVPVNLLEHPVHVRRRKIDLVDHGQQFEVVLEGQIQVGDRLRLDPLGRVDDDDRAVTRHQRAPHLVGEVHVAGGVNQVQPVGLPVLRNVGERDRVALDRDAPFALELHVIEHLFAELPRPHTVARLDQAIGERRLAVIDMRDDAKVANVLHGRPVRIRYAPGRGTHDE